jgi:hypothetical protein
VVVDGDSEFLLGLILANHIAIEERLDLGRARQAAIRRARLFALLIFENLLANAYALVANVRAGILGGRADKLLHLLLRLMAEGTAQRLFWCEPFHRICSLPGRTTTPIIILKSILRRKRIRRGCKSSL